MFYEARRVVDIEFSFFIAIKLVFLYLVISPRHYVETPTVDGRIIRLVKEPNKVRFGNVLNSNRVNLIFLFGWNGF